MNREEFFLIFTFIFLLTLISASLLVGLLLGEQYLLSLIIIISSGFFFISVLLYLRIQHNIDRRYLGLRNEVLKSLSYEFLKEIDNLKKLINENIKDISERLEWINENLKSLSDKSDQFNDSLEILSGNFDNLSREFLDRFKEVGDDIKRQEKIQDGLIDFSERYMDELRDFKKIMIKKIPGTKKTPKKVKK
ncbi:hypothetical protein GF386_05600 [Candidatus Pacearchaeota archaeon]|nr:hypothetical protein [Candidatus Pacearchaeota archaeon]